MTSKKSADEAFMRLALELAKKAEGLTNPNPAVGAVVVRDGVVVGKGYHKRCGLPHAEVCALKSAGPRSRGATLYVTMEPCDHTGRTGPCTDAIVAGGIRRVVIGAKDPNPVTNGRGIRRLKSRGIRTEVGILGDAARALNRPFAKHITTGLPYLTIKMAQSLDGKIATKTGDSKWISSDASRRFVHVLRGKVDGVMVGVGTVLRDDPLLLSKTSRMRQPARIIVDSALRTPPAAKVLSGISAKRPVFIATTRSVDPRRAAIARRLEAKGARILYCASVRGRVALRPLLGALGELGMMHILAEGGGEIVASLLENGLADELVFFVAPKIVGGRQAVTSVEGSGVSTVADALALKNVTTARFGDDILIRAEL